MLSKIYTVDLAWECFYYEYDLYEFNMVDVMGNRLTMYTDANQDYLLGVF